MSISMADKVVIDYRWTSTIVAVPILLVTSYMLYQRGMFLDIYIRGCGVDGKHGS